MVVFRLFGITFVKRVIGLPGEAVAIHAGDIFINGELERKSLDESRALRIAVFDNDFQPGPDGWRERWEVADDHSGPHPLAGTELRLDGEANPGRYQLVTYRHYQLDSRQCEPIGDEYGYNGGERAPPTHVHDFMMECNLEVGRGDGSILLGITDGQDRFVAEVSAGKSAAPRLVRVASWPPQEGDGRWPANGPPQLQAAREVHLMAGKRYRVELAFVDRRVTLAIDGKTVLGPVDLPAAGRRPGVVRPIVLGARGVRAVVRNFRLFRDIHYTSTGPNGRPGKVVQLGPDQYFVLGDNSPNSQDSRFWPDGGAVPARSLLGKPFMVHLPGRVTGGGDEAQPFRGTDWSRVRWIR
jgi:signal peptidase I